ncbi:MAG: M1 family metallopeptidase [Chlorobi bacterium]|nr:M1 family metallopeptidase [Chlorobiota bacterium]
MKNSFTIFLLIFISLLFSNKISSQDYFQQEVNFKISVSLNDSAHSISAYEEIEYTNNSPDELLFIWFHLWPNGYSNNETALAKQMPYKADKGWFDDEDTRGYIDSLDFKVGGETVKWDYDSSHVDICKIILGKPLKSGESIKITTPFFVKIPDGDISRLGHENQSYTITQWYPKPAVYDKFGWHPMPYLNQGEFYSEFGSYDVSITVPENYVVGATGNLQTKEELEWLNELAKETEAIQEFDLEDDEFPPSSKETKTIRFTEKNIHDFAWFADKRFHVLKSEVELPHSGRTVTTWAYFPNSEADLWQKANEYINDAVYYYSLWYGDYPYDNCSAVLAPLSAGGGMEYPTITVIGISMNATALEVVIMHEVGHNWFYGILGSNERDHAWLDEGINSFSETRYMMTKYPDNKLYEMLFKSKELAKLLGIADLQYNDLHLLSYLALARENIDQPLSLSSNDFTEINYGAIVYSKTAVEFSYLLSYFGKEKMNGIMQDYFDTWKFKHPYPDDLQKIFEEHSGENMSWFFDDIIKTTKKIDYKISRVKKDSVLLKTNQQIHGPVSIYGLNNDSIAFEKWTEGFDGKKWVAFPSSKEIKKLEIDHQKQIPELYHGNNGIRTKGVLRKMKPFKLGVIKPIENPGYNEINLFPVVGWNYYNKFMLGGLLYSSPIPSPRFEYQIMPVYGFGTGDLAGMGKIKYNILPYSNTFRKITVYLSGMQYAYKNQTGSYFQKLSMGVNLHFRRKHLKIPIDNFINFEINEASDFTQILYDSTATYKTFYSLKYKYRNRVNNPYGYNISFEGSDDFVKAMLTVDYHVPYNYKTGLDIRFFGGAFLYKSDNYSPVYDFTLSGTAGTNDYNYDNLYLARMEYPEGANFLSKQFVNNYAGFGTFTQIGRSENWMTALSFNSDVPGLSRYLPVRLYVNMAMTDPFAYGSETETTPAFYYDLGGKFSIVKNVFEFYFPIYASKTIWDNSNDMYGNYWQKIRFTLYLDKLNPFDLMNKIF